MLAVLVAVVPVAGIALAAKSLDGPVEPASTTAVAKARQNFLRLTRGYRASSSRYVARKRWAGQMNRVCFVLNRQQRILVGRLYRTGRWRTLVALVRKDVEISKRSIDRARRLPPPRADRARVRRMFALYDRSLLFSEPMVAALERRDLRTFLGLAQQAGVPARQANRIATALGAAVCSRDLE